MTLVAYSTNKRKPSFVFSRKPAVAFHRHCIEFYSFCNVEYLREASTLFLVVMYLPTNSLIYYKSSGIFPLSVGGTGLTELGVRYIFIGNFRKFLIVLTLHLSVLKKSECKLRRAQRVARELTFSILFLHFWALRKSVGCRTYNAMTHVCRCMERHAKNQRSYKVCRVLIGAFTHCCYPLTVKGCTFCVQCRAFTSGL